MATIVQTINSLPKLLKMTPAESKDITEAELKLRVSFAGEYKDYVLAFGAILADGIELTGIAKSEHRDVVSVTNMARKLNPDVPKTMYVVEDTGVDGIVVWQDKSGAIYQTSPNAEPKEIAKTLTEYIEKRIKKGG